MNNAQYWICIVRAFGYSTGKCAKILEHYETARDFVKDKNNWKKLKFLSPKDLKALRAMNIRKSATVLKYCEKHGITILTLDDDEYPVVLKRIKNPPGVLYVKGTLPNLDDEVGITMVGTRQSTLNGEIAASTLAFRIAQAGGIVISGGANGIDSRCSQGAIYANKPSVIVRPCGIDNNYLSGSKKIRDAVAKNGAIISEYEPLEKMPPVAFPARNRLLAALCLGVVVVEAPLKSGVMLTVSHALEMGKDVYALPGDIASQNYTGSNKLLHDGATAIYCASDVLNEYIFAFPHKLNLENAGIPLNEDDIYLRLQRKHSKPVEAVSVPQNDDKNRKKLVLFARSDKKNNDENNEMFVKKKLDFDAEDFIVKVYDCFEGEPLNTDQLVRHSGLKVSDVMYALTELEINDAIKSLPGGRFVTK